MPILFGLDLKLKHSINFSSQKGKWLLSFDKEQDSKSISRSLYKRGSSFETTIPIQMVLSLDAKKSYDVIFNFENGWYVEFGERKDES